MRSTFYSVQGVGIFREWSEVEEALKGLSNPVFKSFRTLPAAEAFLSGWDSSPQTDSNPFGYAGPSQLPPTPLHKLGLPLEERIKKFPSASSAALSPPSSSSSSSSSTSKPSRPQARPSQTLPVPGMSPEASTSSFRRRSPLIQLVVEEEEEPPVEEELTPPSSATEETETDSIPSRSRSGSTSGSSAAGSLGKGRKSIMGLGIGLLSLSPFPPPLTPPASPELQARRSLSPSSTDTGSATSSHQTEALAPTSLKQRMMARRQSWIGTAPSSSTSPTPSSSSPSPSNSPTTSAYPPVKSNSEPTRSLWTDASVPPPPPPSSTPIQLSYPSPARPATDSTPSNLSDSFSSSSAPVFTRQGSSSSSIILPLRSPTPSNASLRRPGSLRSLQHAPSNSSLRSNLSNTSALRNHPQLLDPPRLGRYNSYSTNSSAAASMESLDEGRSSRPSAATSVVSLPSEMVSKMAAVQDGVVGGKKEKKKSGGGFMKKMKKVFGSPA